MKRACGIGFVMLMVLAVVPGFTMAQGTPLAATQTAFAKMDANGDGVVTVAEYNAYWKGRFNDMDADKDGKIMAAEFDAATQQQFGSMDANKDNALVAQEFIVYYCSPAAKSPQTVKAKKIKKIDANKDGKIEDGECVAFWASQFSDMDLNKDGKVTMDEFLQAAKKEFKAIDKNGDGQISVQELDYYYAPPKVKAKKM